MIDACKQGLEELVAFSVLLSLLELHINCCWEEKKKKKKQLPICVLPASILQQNQPEQTGNTPSPILPCPPPPLFLSSLVLTPHCTQVPAELLQQAGRHRT